jgi:transcriptional regulator with XRE-family HTH domain
VIDNDLAILFGQNLKLARVKRNITQEELCEMANLDRSYLSKIEHGTYKLTLHKVYALAAALNCPLAELLPEVDGVKLN